MRKSGDGSDTKFGGRNSLESYWADAVHALRGTPHVIDLRNIGIVDGIEYFDDSKGTNVGATVAAGVVRKRLKTPLFSETISQLRKDREWLSPSRE